MNARLPAAIRLATSSNLNCLVEMNRQTFTWGRSGNRIRKTQRWVERMWLLGILLAALLLFCINLDSLPLLSHEISKTTVASWQWFYPTVDGNLNHQQPPLLYWLIVFADKVGGDNEWAIRLPGAILCAFSVPLLYGIGREIFPSRQSAIFASLIYLTLLPVVGYGRLAIPDGAALCFVMLAIGCALRSRRDFRWALGVGIGLGLICLTKGLFLGFLVGAIVCLFLAWDTPRLLTSIYWWIGLLLGIAPALAWYMAGWLEYGPGFITGVVNQSFKPLWIAVEGNNGFPWYYGVELLKFSAPWLLFIPYGLRLAWEHRNWSWAKLVLVWAGVGFVAISLMATKLPWYILPIYPALALAAGFQLAEVWNGSIRQFYPRFWSIGLSLMAVGGVAATVYFVFTTADRSLPVISTSVALTLAIAAFLVARRDLQFIFILFWGLYVSLLLFTTSPHWMWKLPEVTPVESVDTVLHSGAPTGRSLDLLSLRKPSIDSTDSPG
ncbi:ArnT family glycosyltransferase [Coleofasciculus sp. LEGE 07092]|uniref:ArnT family glycosyltransferase n=1 Tax=Coleofasciculus sp. LEGE 07092 TaxID=2777969 RepID=UPI001D146265|nr:glycosyltransferase family 39 protein [Coleofasciculus sp. LEGE 07092]